MSSWKGLLKSRGISGKEVEEDELHPASLGTWVEVLSHWAQAPANREGVCLEGTEEWGGADLPLFLLGQKAILCHTSPIFSLGVGEAHHKSPTDSHRSTSSSPDRHVSCWPNHNGQFSCKTFYPTPSQMLLLKKSRELYALMGSSCASKCAKEVRLERWCGVHVHGCPVPAVVQCSA